MTTNVVVKAHPGTNQKTKVTVFDKVGEEKKVTKETFYEQGQEVTEYCTDTRSVLVEEVPAT